MVGGGGGDWDDGDVAGVIMVQMRLLKTMPETAPTLYGLVALRAPVCVCDEKESSQLIINQLCKNKYY